MILILVQPTDILDRLWKGGDHIGSAGATHGVGGRSIRDEVIPSEGADKGGNTGKGPRHTTVG